MCVYKFHYSISSLLLKTGHLSRKALHTKFYNKKSSFLLFFFKSNLLSLVRNSIFVFLFPSSPHHLAEALKILRIRKFFFYSEKREFIPKSITTTGNLKFKFSLLIFVPRVFLSVFFFYRIMCLGLHFS